MYLIARPFFCEIVFCLILRSAAIPHQDKPGGILEYAHQPMIYARTRAEASGTLALRRT
jgi:hypothetical protein